MNRIQSVRIRRFKRIKDAAFDLGQLNVLIGANNSGKSSIIQGLHFGIGLLQTIGLGMKWPFVVMHPEIIKASIEFKETFFDEIKALQDREIIQKNGTNNFANTIIESALNKHTKAFFRFKEFLSPDERIRFQIYWNTYICKEETEQYQNVFEDYFAPKFFDCYEVKTSLTDEKEHEMRDLALQRIHDLFEFAELYDLAQNTSHS